MTLTPLIYNSISFSGLSGMLAGNLSATAFADQMLIAKSVMDATTAVQIEEVTPTARDLLSKYGFHAPLSQTGSDSEVDVSYFNDRFKRFFAEKLRESFDRQLSNRRIFIRTHSELADFVGELPAIVEAGLLTYAVVDKYLSEHIHAIQKDIIEVRKQRERPTGFLMSVIRNPAYGVIVLLSAAMCIAAWHNDMPVISASIACGTGLMIYVVHKSNLLQRHLYMRSQEAEYELFEMFTLIATIQAKLKTQASATMLEIDFPPVF